MVADVVTETVSNEKGEVLWFSNYSFSRLNKKGERFIHESLSYEVLSSILDGRSINTVVKKLIKHL